MRESMREVSLPGLLQDRSHWQWWTQDAVRRRRQLWPKVMSCRRVTDRDQKMFCSSASKGVLQPVHHADGLPLIIGGDTRWLRIIAITLCQMLRRPQDNTQLVSLLSRLAQTGLDEPVSLRVSGASISCCCWRFFVVSSLRGCSRYSLFPPTMRLRDNCVTLCYNASYQTTRLYSSKSS